jgi:osmoprotectant transport system ATP-binding protein
LEQTDAPVDLLARPANDFVRAFLGRDPELRRLGLIPLASIPFPREPPDRPLVVQVAYDADARSALDAMLAAGVTEAAVIDDGRAVGVVRLGDLASLHSPADTRGAP